MRLVLKILRYQRWERRLRWGSIYSIQNLDLLKNDFFMINNLKIICLLIYVTFSFSVNADSWLDPSWKEMLDNSDVVAFIEYTSDGDFRAKAKIIEIYKGTLKSGEEIWISGFSNRYGPIDKVKSGDRFFVFLKQNSNDDERIKYWNDELKKKPELKEYIDGLKDGKAYSVWTPTSGDLNVKEETVQYDLISSSFYGEQEYYSIHEFKTFLKVYYGAEDKGKFLKQLISKINTLKEKNESSQALMMLFLLNYNEFNPVFEEYVKLENPASKFTLAQLMGNIKNDKSRDILVKLLEDKNSLVQGEAVRQLSTEKPEFIGPILLNKLTSSSDKNFGPKNIMDPVMNRLDGGKTEIIRTLGELKYAPAIPDLLSLLETENEYLFQLVIDALRNMGNKEYVKYINKHLDNNCAKTLLVHKLGRIIVEDSLTECLPSLKNFISNCNRNLYPGLDFTISPYSGISYFKDSATILFLLKDYEQFFSYKDTLEPSKQKDWTEAYIEAFAYSKVKEARPLIYKSINDWHGLNEDFGDYPGLFKIKKQQEDSLKKYFNSKLKKKGYKINHCIAFIENTKEAAVGETPVVKFIVEITIPIMWGGNEVAEHETLIANELKLPVENIYLKYKDGTYNRQIQERFEKIDFTSPLCRFLAYAEAIPDKRDLIFLQSVLDNDFVTEKYEQNKIKESINKISAELLNNH